MEKYQWINPDNHSIAVDDQKQPVLNENGDLIVLDNASGKCIAVPNSIEVLEIFGFGYPSYGSPGGSPKDSPDCEIKPIVLTDSDQLLWSMRTPCQKDIEATREMLTLVASRKYQDMFNDQCTVKIRVWKRICEELMNQGFRIADSVNEGGIKCHQKWRNLEKSYRNYLISSTDPNNTAPKKPPPYFEALHRILKKKKKYANAASYTTASSNSLVMDDIEEVDSVAAAHHNSSGSGGGGSGVGDVNNPLIDAEVVLGDMADDMDGQNDDHCYVVNSSGHVSKRYNMDSLTVCSTPGGTGGGSGGGVAGGSGGSSSRRNRQPPDVLEQILEQMVRVHRDTMSMHERHFNRVEKLMRENTAQTKRLADVMYQLLQNNGADHEKSTAVIMSIASDAE